MQDASMRQVVVQGTYSLTERDIYEAQLQHKGRYWTAIRLFALTAIAAGIPFLLTRQFGLGIYPIVLGLFMLVQLRFSMKRFFKKNFAGQPQTTMSASETGVELINPKFDSSLKWSAYVAYAEAPNLFMLYTQSNAFNLIPKHALTPEGIDALRGLLRQHVPPKPARQIVALVLVIALSIALALLIVVILLMAWGVFRHAHYLPPHFLSTGRGTGSARRDMIESMHDAPMQQAVVKGTYSLTEKDIYEAQFRHKGWLSMATRIFGLLWVAVGTVSLVSRDWTGLTALIVGLFLLFQLRLSVKSSFKKNFAGQPETTLNASDNGLDFINSKLDSSFNWSACVAYAESKNVFLLYPIEYV